MAKKSKADSKRSEISREQARKEAQQEIAQYEGLYIEEEEILREVQKQSERLEEQEKKEQDTANDADIKTDLPPKTLKEKAPAKHAAPSVNSHEEMLQDLEQMRAAREESARKIEEFLKDNLQQTQEISVSDAAQESEAESSAEKQEHTKQAGQAKAPEKEPRRAAKKQEVHDERDAGSQTAPQKEKKKRKGPNVLAWAAMLCVAAGVGYAARIAQQEWQAASAAYSGAAVTASTSEVQEETPATAPAENQETADLTATEENGAIGILRLVNTQHPLPDGYIPPELEVMDTEDRQLDARAAAAFRELEAAAIADGCPIFLSSGYRSYERQKYLFVEMIQDNLALGYKYEDAYTNTKSLRNIPGTSEHQTGLAADILSVNYLEMDEGFADTKEGKWLKENAARFGFILRYPKDKEAITGTQFEPWHYRYVGVEDATKIMEQGVCLEEYLGMTS